MGKGGYFSNHGLDNLFSKIKNLESKIEFLIEGRLENPAIEASYRVFNDGSLYVETNGCHEIWTDAKNFVSVYLPKDAQISKLEEKLIQHLEK